MFVYLLAIMKVSVYTTLFNAVRHHFDWDGAFRNWATFADEISVAVNTSDDGTWEALQSYVAAHPSFNIRLLATDFSYDDPFCYGKIENAALQNCIGDYLIQQNGDERLLANRPILEMLYWRLKDSGAKAWFTPVINLYGSYHKYVDINRKWYQHLPGLRRGAVRSGIKPNGKVNYDVSSTDELLQLDGNLAPTLSLLDDLSLPSLQAYVTRGMPLVYHLGFCDLGDRAKRAEWWGQFWRKATGGDPNNHITDVAELEKRNTFEHRLPLWDSVP